MLDGEERSSLNEIKVMHIEAKRSSAAWQSPFHVLFVRTKSKGKDGSLLFDVLILSHLINKRQENPGDA